MHTKPIGVIHWAGVWNGFPAIALSYYGGAKLWYFDGEWKYRRFDDLVSLKDFINQE